MTANEEHAVNEFLRLIPVIPLNEEIEKETVELCRSTTLKLPDAIIGATAIIYDARLVSRDPHFLKCCYDKLQIWGTR